MDPQPESLANIVMLLLSLVCVFVVAAVAGAIVSGKSCARAKQKQSTNPNHKIQHRLRLQVGLCELLSSCLPFCSRRVVVET